MAYECPMVKAFEDELAAAKQEIARMKPVFDAAVEYVKTRLSPKYDPASFEPDFEIVAAVRKLDR